MSKKTLSFDCYFHNYLLGEAGVAAELMFFSPTLVMGALRVTLAKSASVVTKQ